MTKATCRKKALPFLLADFEGRCAYCLDPGEFRNPSETHVEHFNCKLKPRKKNQYKNLMLACATCNHYKHDKLVANPFDHEQRLLNCTEENEFLGHVVETDDGQWYPVTKAGEYHLQSIGLMERSHKNKRGARKFMLLRVLELCKTAIQYKCVNPQAVHAELIQTIRSILKLLDSFPPMVTTQGVMDSRTWLKMNGADVDFLAEIPPDRIEIDELPLAASTGLEPHQEHRAHLR